MTIYRTLYAPPSTLPTITADTVLSDGDYVIDFYDRAWRAEHLPSASGNQGYSHTLTLIVADGETITATVAYLLWTDEMDRRAHDDATYAEPDGYICTDCAMWCANGDLSSLDLDNADDAETYARVTTADPDTNWTVGNDDESRFIWSRCDRCHSTLGGDRHSAYIGEHSAPLPTDFITELGEWSSDPIVPQPITLCSYDEGRRPADDMYRIAIGEMLCVMVGPDTGDSDSDAYALTIVRHVAGPNIVDDPDRYFVAFGAWWTYTDPDISRIMSDEGWCDDADDSERLTDLCQSLESNLPDGIIATWTNGFTITDIRHYSDDAKSAWFDFMETWY